MKFQALDRTRAMGLARNGLDESDGQLVSVAGGQMVSVAGGLDVVGQYL